MKVKIGSRASTHRTNPFCLRGASMGCRLLELLDRVQVEVGACRILADAHHGVADEGVGRHRQVERRGTALEDPAGEVIARAVARAEVSALPTRPEIAAGLRV